MKKYVQLSTAILVLFIAASAFAGVTVSSPSSTVVGSSVSFVASATTSCSSGVSAMGIYKNSQLIYTVNGSKINHTFSFSPGTYSVVVKEWDKCGGSSGYSKTIYVGGKTFYNIQNAKGWQSYGQQPPSYVDCTSCSGLNWSMTQGLTSPTISGKTTQYRIGGSKPYSDVLWLNHLIGPFSSQGLPDTSKTLVPPLHYFTYDIYFWGHNLTSLSNAMEFDINQYYSGMGFIWGLECRMWNRTWALWDSYNKKWTSTSLPCKPISNGWNHLVYQVERTSTNKLLYKTITLNGVTYVVNKTFSHFNVSGWYGLVANYQLDGDYQLSDYSTYVDKLNLSYK